LWEISPTQKSGEDYQNMGVVTKVGGNFKFDGNSISKIKGVVAKIGGNFKFEEILIAKLRR